MIRPTHREILHKITQAGEAVARGKIAIINPVAIAADALELAYEMAELAAVLSELLVQVKPGDYVGASPPQPSYEEEIFQSDLYAFICSCSRFGCDVYFKFSLKNDTLWLVSLHRERSKKRETP